MRHGSGRLMVTIPALAGILVANAHQTPGAPGTTKICTWKDDKKAALTLTIDDNCWKDVPFVTSIVNPKGIKVTWALITGQIVANPDFYGTWENWRTIPAMGMGHELASHGVIIGSVLNLKTDEEIRATYRDSKVAIEKNVPANGKCISIIYHYDTPKDETMPIMPEYYIVGRGGNGGLNDPSPSRDLLADCGMWRLCSYDRTSAAIDKTISQGKWYIWFSHEINNNGGNIPESFFSKFCDYAYSKRDLLWFGTMRDVAQYIYERDASTAQVVSVTPSTITLNLTHSLSTAVCDFSYPLTLKTEVFSAWRNVRISQRDNAAMVKVFNEAGKDYVYFDARPNAGHITIDIGGNAVASDQAKTTTPLSAAFADRIISAARLSRICGERGWRVFDMKGHIVTAAKERLSDGTYLIGTPGSMIRIIAIP